MDLNTLTPKTKLYVLDRLISIHSLSHQLFHLWCCKVLVESIRYSEGREIQRQHASSTQKGHRSNADLNQGALCCNH